MEITNNNPNPIASSTPETVPLQQGSPKTFFGNIWRFTTSRVVGISMLIVIVILSFGSGVRYGQQHPSSAGAYPNIVGSNDVKNRTTPSHISSQVDFSEFWEVWDLLANTYFDKSKVNAQKMMYGAISGMVSSLGDPYTTFLSPDQNKQAKDDLGGNFEGVGIELGYKDNNLVVMSPLDDTPAKRAGILAGDYITKIGGQATDGISLPEAVDKIRGPKGSHITLELYRTGADKPYTVDLTREEIHVKSVTFAKKEGNIGYIKLSRFGDQTNSEWDDAVDQALKSNVSAIVLDLRDNPGGYLESAIYIGSEFVNGTIVKQENSDGSKKVFTSVRQGKLLQVPVVVLINKGSASAAEILAGAISANNRGKLVGETSFGKGTIQEVEELDKGSGIHITRARWLMPNDYWVHMKGIKPDVEVTMTVDDTKAGKDPQLDKAIEVVKTMIK